ncbi:MAG: RidA family protein [Burkholderiales bacterium]|nr:RidA family protein [Burkholderiales bacterium]
MVKRYDVQGVRSPGGRYSLVGEVGPNARLFYIAGQIGTDAQGVTPPEFEAQAELVYRNIATILKECGLGMENLVKINVFLIKPEHIDAWRTIQKKAFGEVAPASTLVFVVRLARPELLIEVEAVAAKD